MLNSSRETILENECTLISDNGERVEIFCGEFPIYSGEFHAAYQQGIHAQKALLINSDEYSYEERVEYGSVLYAVYRVFARTDGYTELYLNQNAGGGY